MCIVAVPLTPWSLYPTSRLDIIMCVIIFVLLSFAKVHLTPPPPRNNRTQTFGTCQPPQRLATQRPPLVQPPPPPLRVVNGQRSRPSIIPAIRHMEVAETSLEAATAIMIHSIRSVEPLQQDVHHRPRAHQTHLAAFCRACRACCQAMSES